LQHDSSGPDDYEKMRATMLKDLGYVGFAADIFGSDFAGEDNSTLLREQMGAYRGNNSLFYGRIQAAVDVVKGHPDVMPDKIAVIGC
jgi:dienelactone hydrolase